MHALTRWGFVLALLPLAACNTNSSNPMQATVPQPMPAAITASAQDQNFVQTAAGSDQFEIRSSQLALQKSRNPAVRQFAQRMIDDHSASTQALTQLASAKGIPTQGALDPTQQRLMATLEGASRTFDREYWRAQTLGHTATLAAFQTEIASGYDADVKGFAQQNLPMIQDHLAMAQRMGRAR